MRMDAAGVEESANGRDGGGDRNNDDAERERRSGGHRVGTVATGPVLRAVDAWERRLDGCLEAAMVRGVQGEEPERLFGPGDSAQHFRRAQHWAGVSKKHEAYPGAQVDGALDAE